MDWKLIEPHFRPKDFNTGRESEVRWVVNNLAGGGRLLDVGCLDSRLAELLLPYYDEVYGIDIREYDDRGQNSPKSYKFLIGSIIDYPFEDDHFDEITFVSTLEHIGLKAYTNLVIDNEADKRSLKSCHRILKPAGRVLVTIPYSNTEDGRYINGVMWERNYSDASLNNLIDDSLFGVGKMELIGRNMCFILNKR